MYLIVPHSNLFAMVSVKRYNYTYHRYKKYVSVTCVKQLRYTFNDGKRAQTKITDCFHVFTFNCTSSPLLI